jgi:hypothetical protein
MESEDRTQKRLWIEQIQARYRELQQKYLGCSDRAKASQLATEMRVLEAAILGIEQGAIYGTALFAKIPRHTLELALNGVNELIRPEDNVYYQELENTYKTVRRFLPTLVKQIKFGANVTGEPIILALDWLRTYVVNKKINHQTIPRAIINKSWQPYVLKEDDTIDIRAYTFCTLSALQSALQRRDVFVAPSWRYADPRSGLLEGADWETSRPIICRTLGLSVSPTPVLTALSKELDDTYRAVESRLPHNPAVRFDKVNDKLELVLSPLEKMEESNSLLSLRKKVIRTLLTRVVAPGRKRIFTKRGSCSDG